MTARDLPRDERWQAIYRLHDSGRTGREIAEELGICTRTVTRALGARRGYVKPPRTVFTPELTEKIVAALEDGWSYCEIGRTFGVSDHYVAQRYPGYGFTREQAVDYGVMVRQLERICPDHAVAVRSITLRLAA